MFVLVHEPNQGHPDWRDIVLNLTVNRLLNKFSLPEITNLENKNKLNYCPTNIMSCFAFTWYSRAITKRKYDENPETVD